MPLMMRIVIFITVGIHDIPCVFHNPYFIDDADHRSCTFHNLHVIFLKQQKDNSHYHESCSMIHPEILAGHGISGSGYGGCGVSVAQLQKATAAYCRNNLWLESIGVGNYLSYSYH